MKSIIPVASSLKIEKFAGGSFTVADSYTKNIIFDQYDDGALFATQRPGINIFDDASVTTADTRGRGIHFWQKTGELYFVNDDTVYKGGYSVALVATITAGKEKVYFSEVGDYLVILDPENNQGWYINSATPSTLVEITDVDFPPKQTPSLQIAKGGVSLNGTLYVMDEDGTIWGSEVEDPTAWNALNFITSEIENDGGIALFRHHGHLAAFGTRTLEYFFDAANPTGSPLSARTDITFSIGAVDQHCFLQTADALFFLGVTKSGALGVYVIEKFVPVKISEADLDSLLSSAIVADQMTAFASGFNFGTTVCYILTLSFVVSLDYVVQETYVFSSRFKTWSVWGLSHTGYTGAPIVAWTTGKTSRSGEGITSLGDVVSVADDFNSKDITVAQIYVDSGYVDDGYVSDTGQSGVVFPTLLQFGHYDGGTRNRKRMDRLRVMATTTDSAQNVTVRWSDEDNDTFNTGVIIDLSNNDKRVSRLGRFRQRNIRLEASFTEQVRIKGVETDLEVLGI